MLPGSKVEPAREIGPSLLALRVIAVPRLECMPLRSVDLDCGEDLPDEPPRGEEADGPRDEHEECTGDEHVAKVNEARHKAHHLELREEVDEGVSEEVEPSLSLIHI